MAACPHTMRMPPTFQRPRTAAQTSRRGTLVWQVGRRLSRRSPTVQGWIKVGFTFELRAISLGIHAAMHPGLTGGRRTRPRRRPANLSLVAPRSSYSTRRSNCHHGANVVQDRCPAFSIAGGGEVRLLAGPGACVEPLCAAAACSGAPNHLLPVRVGHAAYVRRGGAEGAAGALNGRFWR